MDPLLKIVNEKSEKLKNEILNDTTMLECNNNAYYVSNNGDDSADGKTPDTAWKTLKKASEYEYSFGDVIYLERGSIFRDYLVLKTNGLSVSAYGNGDKPKIYGSKRNYNDFSDWENTEYKNVYISKYKFDEDVGNIVFNDGETCGFRQLYLNFGFTGKIEELSNDLQFYYDSQSKSLYLRSDFGNPTERFNSIEICQGGCICLAANDVVVDNICCKYCGAHAIGGQGNHGVLVQNCEIGWIGGNILFFEENGHPVRFGNGIEIYASCKDYAVKHNYLYQIYDAGMSHQYFQDAHSYIIMENVAYENNLVEKCTYSIEYALMKQTDSKELMKNILIKDNILRFAGFGFGSQRPDSDTPAHIKSWDVCNTSENFVIENNILDRSNYMIIQTATYDEKSLPYINGNIYIQNNFGELGRYGVVPTELILPNNTNFFAFDKNAQVLIIDK